MIGVGRRPPPNRSQRILPLPLRLGLCLPLHLALSLRLRLALLLCLCAALFLARIRTLGPRLRLARRQLVALRLGRRRSPLGQAGNWVR